MFSARQTLLAAASLLLPLVSMATERSLRCQQKTHFGQEGWLETAVHLRLDGRRLLAVSLDSATVVQATRTGYPCGAEFRRDDGVSVWQEQAASTTISAAGSDSGAVSTLRLTRRRHDVDIDLRGLDHGETCGARGQWPRRILLPLAGGPCRVKYD